MEWLLRLKEAMDYIESRMEEKLDIEAVASVACSSPFHFQRMFSMVTGCTVAEYVRRRKLTLAAQELASSSAKVIDVALKYGYESPESFAKAFRKAHGITPTEAREPGVVLKAFPRITFHLSLKGDQEMEYRIIERPAFTVVGKTYEVSCKDGENHRLIPTFWAACGQDGTIDKLAALSPKHETLGICMDFRHPEERFTYMIGAESSAPLTDDGFVAREIPAATWAVFTSTGPMPHAIQNLWGRIFQEWFPSSSYEHAGGPEFELYPDEDPNAGDYKCEVWIPIKPKQ
ncbi:AraC family transcriptional regulator [Paenibacillus phyllosphaerae]|uniref:AraC family transcriptional regulator n=1 Tax=Paenibacillus phyllosphaerae TaxID=274593 RepID=A0A7W5AXY0_9BACL|nr:AraC family transcriptional regulator [Paenibacillus phyllosphaerae]MBB3110809.1 AraC family transcriptional regulator [Paenibacillus phyllosphaerae]